MRSLALAVILLGGVVTCLSAFSVDEPERACDDCHAGLTDGKFQHKPVGEGGCETCHKAAGNRLEEARQSCLACHESILDPTARSRHPHVEPGSCGTCHLPHASDFPHLLPTGSITYCLSCHPDQIGGKSHPVGVGLEDPRTGGPLTCTSTCHEPHVSSRKFLVRDFAPLALCEVCHGEKL